MTPYVSEAIGRLSAHVDPANECDACGDGLPGVLCPAGNDDNHVFVQSCDACNAIPEGDDTAACEKAALVLGWVVHRRYDDATLQAWRPFITKAGYDDDADFYCIGADEYGWEPDSEVKIEGATACP